MHVSVLFHWLTLHVCVFVHDSRLEKLSAGSDLGCLPDFVSTVLPDRHLEDLLLSLKCQKLILCQFTFHVVPCREYFTREALS
jgi:hypothetical protein